MNATEEIKTACETYANGFNGASVALSYASDGRQHVVTLNYQSGEDEQAERYPCLSRQDARKMWRAVRDRLTNHGYVRVSRFVA
jgi:hypothetical protein